VPARSSAAASEANSDLFVRGCFESLKIFQDVGSQEQVRVVVPDPRSATQEGITRPISSALWMAESELMKVNIARIFSIHV
jgi:hypothetical protein